MFRPDITQTVDRALQTNITCTYLPTYLAATDSDYFLCRAGSFDVLVYTEKDTEVPACWGESSPHFVVNSEEVRLRSFTTTIHKVDAMVTFKKTD